jgi:pyruvate ferredoxin oxidoreductase gamma subunit
MIQIRLHGRGGQGVVTGAELIALAAFQEGKQTQAFPSFGVERSGAPIMAFARIDDQPIKTREQIYTPDILVIQDQTLIPSSPLLSGTSAKTLVFINSEKTAAELFLELKKEAAIFKNPFKLQLKNIIAVPATAIALEIIGKNLVNTVILGALAKHGGLFTLKSLQQAVKDKLAGKNPSIIAKNLQAIEKIYTY